METELLLTVYPRQRSPQFHAVRRWVLSCLGTVEHEEAVAHIASRLFNLTAVRHGLTSADLRLLRLAAMVHDVGRCIDNDTHPLEGARLIRAETHLPLSETERRQIAYLTRFHRGSVPETGCDGILRRCDDPARLLRLLALLRAADALDSRALESPDLSFQMSGRKLRIACHLKDDSAKARRVFSRRKKFRLLEELLDLRVDVEILAARELQRVA